jgi:N-acetylmuramoyl-L-alanine amidase
VESDRFGDRKGKNDFQRLGTKGIIPAVSRALPLRFLAWLAVPLAAHSQMLSPVADPPKWSDIQAMQESVTREEFERLLNTVYAPKDAAVGLIDVLPDHASIVEEFGSPGRFDLRFAKNAASVHPAPRFWRTRKEVGAAPKGRPMGGLRIALDPGHLGGEWARMEGRWYQTGADTLPVMEGDLALRTSEHLAKRLEAMGATVSWVRKAPGPTTALRPADFFSVARDLLAAQGIPEPRITYSQYEDPGRKDTIQNQAELLFYRMAEIRNRARLVNNELKPDLVLCLHFNAEAWGRDSEPEFVPRNHFHVLVNGAYSASELRLDDNRHDMLLRLLGGMTSEEERLATKVAETFARASALPPWTYTRDIAVPVNDNPYVWARNLLANRLYRCPVVFLEPYVMNSREVWERVQAGDFEGERVIAGTLRKSICREYADAVADGLAKAWQE